MKKLKVIAAMSGGVDSAVAAARAVDAGFEVVGVHLALSSNPQKCFVQVKQYAAPAGQNGVDQFLGLSKLLWRPIRNAHAVSFGV